MAFDQVVVRVRSKIGISRLCFTKNSTFGDLKKELSNRIKFSDGEVVKLYLEGTSVEVKGSDHELLRDLDITHGTSLYLDQSSSKLSYARISSSSKPVDSQGDVEMDDQEAQVSDKQYSGDSSSSKDEVVEKKESEGPLFKSFDAYLHENSFSIGDLPLKNSFLPVQIKRGVMNKLPMGVTIRHQKYRHVDHLEMMNVEEVRNFANYWLADLEMSFQRIGWMYGYYTEDPHYPYGIRAVCEAIYEPPQMSQINYVSLMEDNLLPKVDKIANRLGLERIGLIFTRLPNECFLTAKELMRTIEMQYNSLKHIHYTGYPVSTMVTCTMSPDDNGQPLLDAFMASDMALALFRDELLDNNQDDDNIIKIRKVQHSQEIMPPIIESGKEVTSFDTSWLMVRINESAPIKPNSFFGNSGRNHRFPVENRTYSSTANSTIHQSLVSDCSARVTNSNERFRKWDKKILADYFNTNSPETLWNDFHLLIYVCQVLDVDTALAICDCIVKKEQVDDLVKDLLLQT
ncbi:hypothetical protein MACJ_001438 [Theileria orientalis]|uniref:MPN domain-containing protein n=1 Tax=Theileria orientalis TaxID=68886 RepID=A0A976QRJ0_THEOR|nr:hypothetical protein MACJ_001438 [Theileria orientalis]